MKREISYNFYLFFIQIGKADKALDLDIWGRMHDADVSASLRLKLTYDGLAH